MSGQLSLYNAKVADHFWEAVWLAHNEVSLSTEAPTIMDLKRKKKWEQEIGQIPILK